MLLQINVPVINPPVFFQMQKPEKKKKKGRETVWVYQVQKFKKGICGVLPNENQI